MIYDHSLVHGWRTRIEKEELAARDTLRKFITQKKGIARPSSAPSNIRYNDRNGPWGNGGNFAEARLDQPLSDMNDKRLKENINAWDKGYRPPPTKAVSPAMQTAMLKAKKEMEDALAKKESGEEEEDGLKTARSHLMSPSETLLRISPLTDVVPEPHVKGIRRSWAYLENDPVKIQCRQEDALHTEGTLEMRTMHRLSPLMRMRPKTAKPLTNHNGQNIGGRSNGPNIGPNQKKKRPMTAKPHYRATEENYGHIGEDGSRGDIRKGWIAQNLIPTAYNQPLASNRRDRKSVV